MTTPRQHAAQYARGHRPIATNADEREALIAWFDRLPPAFRADKTASWLLFKIRRAQRSYEQGVKQEPLAGAE